MLVKVMGFFDLNEISKLSAREIQSVRLFRLKGMISPTI
jgi:hypothetical protein